MRTQLNASLRLHELWSVSDKLFFIGKVNVISVMLTVEVCAVYAHWKFEYSTKNVWKWARARARRVHICLVDVCTASGTSNRKQSVNGRTLDSMWMFTIFQIGRKTKSLLFMDAIVTKHWTGGVTRHGCIGLCVNEFVATRENNYYYLFVSSIETISMRPRPPQPSQFSKRRTIKYLLIIIHAGEGRI